MSDWNPPETAPKDGKPFLITTAGPEIDLCCWVDDHFQDYFFKQTIHPEWPHFIGWKPMPTPALIGNTEAETRRMNGWPSPSINPPTSDGGEKTKPPTQEQG